MVCPTLRSADEILIQLLLDSKLMLFDADHGDGPPENVSVAKDVGHLVEERLLLKVNKVAVPHLLRDFNLDRVATLALLQVVDEAPVLLDQVQLVAEKAEAEGADKNRNCRSRRRDYDVDRKLDIVALTDGSIRVPVAPDTLDAFSEVCNDRVQAVQAKIQHEHQEDLKVALANTVVDPAAMMIHAQNAATAFTAVVGARRLDTLALLALLHELFVQVVKLVFRY